MAWHFSTNQSPATYTLGLYQLVTEMLAAGWTKVKDSDGTTYSSSGAQVTGGGTGAHGLNNVEAWVILQSPAGSGHPQVSFQRGTASDATWRIKYSPAAGFTGGSPGATQTPSATDEAIVCGGGTDASPSFSTWFGGTEGSTRYNAGAQDVAPYAFWAQGWPIGGGTPIGGIFYDGVINGAASGSADSDPHVILVDFSLSGWTSSVVGAGSATYSKAMQPSVGTMASPTGVSFPWTTPASALSTDPTNGKDQLRPLEFFFSTGGYYKGQTQSILWEMTGTSTNQRTLGYLLSLVTSADYIVVGQIAVPWDGSAPLI